MKHEHNVHTDILYVFKINIKCIWVMNTNTGGGGMPSMNEFEKEN